MSANRPAIRYNQLVANRRMLDQSVVVEADVAKLRIAQAFENLEQAAGEFHSFLEGIVKENQQAKALQQFILNKDEVQLDLVLRLRMSSGGSEPFEEEASPEVAQMIYQISLQADEAVANRLKVEAYKKQFRDQHAPAFTTSEQFEIVRTDAEVSDEIADVLQVDGNIQLPVRLLPEEYAPFRPQKRKDQETFNAHMEQMRDALHNLLLEHKIAVAYEQTADKTKLVPCEDYVPLRDVLADSIRRTLMWQKRLGKAGITDDIEQKIQQVTTQLLDNRTQQENAPYARLYEALVKSQHVAVERDLCKRFMEKCMQFDAATSEIQFTHAPEDLIYNMMVSTRNDAAALLRDYTPIDTADARTSALPAPAVTHQFEEGAAVSALGGTSAYDVWIAGGGEGVMPGPPSFGSTIKRGWLGSEWESNLGGLQATSQGSPDRAVPPPDAPTDDDISFTFSSSDTEDGIPLGGVGALPPDPSRKIDGLDTAADRESDLHTGGFSDLSSMTDVSEWSLMSEREDSDDLGALSSLEDVLSETMSPDAIALIDKILMMAVATENLDIRNQKLEAIANILEFYNYVQDRTVFDAYLQEMEAAPAFVSPTKEELNREIAALERPSDIGEEAEQEAFLSMLNNLKDITFTPDNRIKTTVMNSRYKVEQLYKKHLKNALKETRDPAVRSRLVNDHLAKVETLALEVVDLKLLDLSDVAFTGRLPKVQLHRTNLSHCDFSAVEPNSYEVTTFTDATHLLLAGGFPPEKEDPILEYAQAQFIRVIEPWVEKLTITGSEGKWSEVHKTEIEVLSAALREIYEISKQPITGDADKVRLRNAFSSFTDQKMRLQDMVFILDYSRIVERVKSLDLLMEWYQAQSNEGLLRAIDASPAIAAQIAKKIASESFREAIPPILLQNYQTLSSKEQVTFKQTLSKWYQEHATDAMGEDLWVGLRMFKGLDIGNIGVALNINEAEIEKSSSIFQQTYPDLQAEMRRLLCNHNRQIIRFAQTSEDLRYAIDGFREESKEHHFPFDLSGLDLSQHDLTNVDLTGADLRNTNLSDTNLTHANLTNTNLQGAIVAGADLTEAVLDPANLQKAIGIHHLKGVNHLLPELLLGSGREVVHNTIASMHENLEAMQETLAMIEAGTVSVSDLATLQAAAAELRTRLEAPPPSADDFEGLVALIDADNKVVAYQNAHINQIHMLQFQMVEAIEAVLHEEEGAISKWQELQEANRSVADAVIGALAIGNLLEEHMANRGITSHKDMQGQQAIDATKLSLLAAMDDYALQIIEPTLPEEVHTVCKEQKARTHNLIDFRSQLLLHTMYENLVKAGSDAEFRTALTEYQSACKLRNIRCDLKGIAFAHRDLTEVDFTNCDVRHCDFTGANLQHATFNSMWLTDANFTDCDCSGSIWRDLDISGVNFTNALAVDSAVLQATQGTPRIYSPQHAQETIQWLQGVTRKNALALALTDFIDTGDRVRFREAVASEPQLFYLFAKDRILSTVMITSDSASNVPKIPRMLRNLHKNYDALSDEERQDYIEGVSELLENIMVNNYAAYTRGVTPSSEIKRTYDIVHDELIVGGTLGKIAKLQDEVVGFNDEVRALQQANHLLEYKQQRCLVRSLARSQFFATDNYYINDYKYADAFQELERLAAEKDLTDPTVDVLQEHIGPHHRNAFFLIRKLATEKGLTNPTLADLYKHVSQRTVDGSTHLNVTSREQLDHLETLAQQYHITDPTLEDLRQMDAKIADFHTAVDAYIVSRKSHMLPGAPTKEDLLRVAQLMAPINYETLLDQVIEVRTAMLESEIALSGATQDQNAYYGGIGIEAQYDPDMGAFRIVEDPDRLSSAYKTGLRKNMLIASTFLNNGEEIVFEEMYREILEQNNGNEAAAVEDITQRTTELFVGKIGTGVTMKVLDAAGQISEIFQVKRNIIQGKTVSCYDPLSALTIDEKYQAILAELNQLHPSHNPLPIFMKALDFHFSEGHFQAIKQAYANHSTLYLREMLNQVTEPEFRRDLVWEHINRCRQYDLPIDLSDMNLTAINFTGIDLTDANLAQSRVESEQLQGVPIRGVNFSGVVLKDPTALVRIEGERGKNLPSNAMIALIRADIASTRYTVERPLLMWELAKSPGKLDLLSLDELKMVLFSLTALYAGEIEKAPRDNPAYAMLQSVMQSPDPNQTIDALTSKDALLNEMIYPLMSLQGVASIDALITPRMEEIYSQLALVQSAFFHNILEPCENLTDIPSDIGAYVDVTRKRIFPALVERFKVKFSKEHSHVSDEESVSFTTESIAEEVALYGRYFPGMYLDFRDLDLKGVIFPEVAARTLDFAGANLEGADLSRLQGLTAEMLENASNISLATLPISIEQTLIFSPFEAIHRTRRMPNYQKAYRQIAQDTYPHIRQFFKATGLAVKDQMKQYEGSRDKAVMGPIIEKLRAAEQLLKMTLTTMEALEVFQQNDAYNFYETDEQTAYQRRVATLQSLFEYLDSQTTADTLEHIALDEVQRLLTIVGATNRLYAQSEQLTSEPIHSHADLVNFLEQWQERLIAECDALTIDTDTQQRNAVIAAVSQFEAAVAFAAEQMLEVKGDPTKEAALLRQLNDQYDQSAATYYVSGSFRDTHVKTRSEGGTGAWNDTLMYRAGQLNPDQYRILYEKRVHLQGEVMALLPIINGARTLPDQQILEFMVDGLVDYLYLHAINKEEITAALKALCEDNRKETIAVHSENASMEIKGAYPIHNPNRYRELMAHLPESLRAGYEAKIQAFEARYYANKEREAALVSEQMALTDAWMFDPDTTIPGFVLLSDVIKNALEDVVRLHGGTSLAETDKDALVATLLAGMEIKFLPLSDEEITAIFEKALSHSDISLDPAMPETVKTAMISDMVRGVINNFSYQPMTLAEIIEQQFKHKLNLSENSQYVVSTVPDGIAQAVADAMLPEVTSPHIKYNAIVREGARSDVQFHLVQLLEQELDLKVKKGKVKHIALQEGASDRIKEALNADTLQMDIGAHHLDRDQFIQEWQHMRVFVNDSMALGHVGDMLHGLQYAATLLKDFMAQMSVNEEYIHYAEEIEKLLHTQIEQCATLEALETKEKQFHSPKVFEALQHLFHATDQIQHELFAIDTYATTDFPLDRPQMAKDAIVESLEAVYGCIKDSKKKSGFKDHPLRKAICEDGSIDLYKVGDLSEAQLRDPRCFEMLARKATELDRALEEVERPREQANLRRDFRRYSEAIERGEPVKQLMSRHVLVSMQVAANVVMVVEQSRASRVAEEIPAAVREASKSIGETIHEYSSDSTIPTEAKFQDSVRQQGASTGVIHR